MKTRWRYCLAIGSFFVLSLTERASAHDGWIEVPAIVEKGQVVTIALMLGNHTNEHKSYRLAGKWNPNFTKLMVIEPSGKINDITASLIDLGEDEEKTGPKGPKGFHIATFTPKTEGVYTFWRGRSRCCNTATRQSFAAFEAHVALSRHFGFPASWKEKNPPVLAAPSRLIT
jgi:hypothetical protein